MKSSINKYRLINIVAFFLYLMSFGCGNSNELTREKAKEQISKKYPQIVQDIIQKQIEIPTQVQSGPGSFGWHLDTIRNYQQMDKEGLIKLTDRKPVMPYISPYTGPTGPIRSYIYQVKLTSEGEKYLISKRDGASMVKLGEITFGNITGLLKDPSGRVAQVEYYTEVKNYTPFAKYFGYESNRVTRSNRVEHFMRYDDGWRIGN
jgi:hypothetical protein